MVSGTSTHRWAYYYKNKLTERDRLKPQLRITIYGSFQPHSEKKRLLNLVQSLRKKGYADCDIVEGKLRGNPKKLSPPDICQFYLEHSDVNFLVFTHKGKRLGVTDELGFILHSPLMYKMHAYCVIFDDFSRGYSSLTPLQLEKVKQIGLTHVEFRTKKDLRKAATSIAWTYIFKLQDVLKARCL